MSANEQPITKKRKRMHYACVECNRRKHKCDRKIPCAPCVQRGIADSCRPFEDGDEHGDLRARLARVEHLLDGLLARENSTGPGSGQDAGSDVRRPSPASTERRTTEEREEHLDGGLNGAAGNYFGGNALPSVTSTSIEAEVRGNNGAPHPQPTISARTIQANLALRQAIKEGACNPDVLLTLLSELPPKDDITALFDIFFRDINPVRFPLPESDIRRSFDELNAFTWGSGREDGDDGAIHIIYLPLLFMIIATTTFCLPRTVSKQVDVKAQAKRYYHAYRRAASIANLLPTTTTLIYAHLLAARFLIIIRTPAEGWSLLGATLRLAQALGLHRDGARLGLPPPETERRRRLWAHLFYADASMCLMLGRPMGVRVGDCDVQEPGKVRLEEDAEDEAAAAGAEGEDKVTRWTFMALRHRLAHITSRVIEHFQDLAGGRHYDTVIELDRELVTFWEALPALYKVEGGEKLRERNGRGRETRPSQDRDRDRDRSASRSRDREGSSHPDEPMGERERGQPSDLGEEPGAYPFLALHRFMINTEVQYVRIALHRPYVLRAGEKYDPSRAACFEAARIDRRCREIFRREVVWPDNRARRDHMGGLYRLFNSTMILGIALLLNPAGPNAAELRGYLDDFIQIHANQAAHDVTSARELKIIQLFRAKADDALRLRSPMKPGSTPTMSSQPPNQITPGPRSLRSSRGFTMDSGFPTANRASPPHGSRRPRSRTSVSSLTIGTPGVIDNPPLPPGLSPTTPFAPISFSSPTTTTYAISNNRRSSNAALSPTTPRDAQSLLSPAPRTVSPLLMLGLGGNSDGTPPGSFNNLSTDALPFTDDTQTLFDQASWQYAMANPGIGLGFDWSNLNSSDGMSELGLGLDEMGTFGLNGYGAALAAPSSNAGSTGGEESTSPPTLLAANLPAPDTPEGLLAPGSGGRVRSGSGIGKAPEGWGYWEGLVDAIVNQQGIAGGST